MVNQFHFAFLKMQVTKYELQSPATFATSLVGLISSISQAMSKISNAWNNFFLPDCQKASVPVQLQILCSLLNDGCNPQIKLCFSELKLILFVVLVNQSFH